MAKKKKPKNDSDKNGTKKQGIAKGKKLYVSMQGLADHFGVSVQAVQKWTHRDCPIEERGGVGKTYVFDLDAVKKWYSGYNRKNTGSDGPGSQGKLNFSQETARLNAAKADLAELDLKKRLGELIDAEEAQKLWLKLITAVRAKFIVLPKKLAPQAFGCKTVVETVSVLEMEIHDILRDLAVPDFTVSTIGKSSDRGDGKVRAPAKTKRKPVGRPRKNAKPRSKR